MPPPTSCSQEEWDGLLECPPKPLQCPELQTDFGKTHEAAISDHDGISKTQASDDIILPTLCPEKDVRALEGVLHRRGPDENTPHTSSCCSSQGRILQARGGVYDQNEDSKTSKMDVELHSPPYPPKTTLLLPHTPLLGKKTPSLRIRTGSGKPETRRTNQLEQEPSVSPLTARPCDND